jgi:hypothetical protein
MAEKKVIELEVKTNSASLKAQLREAQQEVQKLSEKFGATSTEAINAAKKAAELKDAIGDAKVLTDAFNPDAKFTALSGALSGVASGFAAVEGSLGLIGVESSAVQEQLLKVQSAMALAQGIDGVTSSIQSFKNLGAIIKSTTVVQGILTAAQSLYGVVVGVSTGALKAFRIALAATGIGAVIVLLGVAASAMGLFGDKTDETAEKQKRLKDIQKKNNDELEKSVELQKKIRAERKGGASELEGEVAILKASGATSKAIYEAERKAIQEKVNDLNYVKGYRGKLNAEEREELRKLNVDLIVLGKEYYKSVKDQRTNDATDAKEKRDAVKAQEKADRDAELERQRQEAKANLEAGKQEAIEQIQAIELAEAEYYKNKKTQREQDLDDVSNKYFQLIEAAKTNGLDTTTLLEAQREAEKEINDKYDKEAYDSEVANFNKSKELADKEMADAKMLADAKFNVARNTFSVIGDLAKSFAGKSEKEQKKAFNIQKAANIAGAIMDTYKAANSAYASMSGIPYVGPFLGAAAAGVAIGAGIANVNNIRNQEFGGGAIASSAPSSTGSLGSGSNNQAITPNFNIIGNQNQTQLAQLNQAPVKAYVVGSDVTTQQMLDKKKIQNATI